MQKFPQLYDLVWLQETYQYASTRQIARLLGCAPSLVTGALHRAGIALRPAKRLGPPELSDPAWLAEQYQRLTTHEIAALLHCVQKSVLMAMRRHKIPLRGHGKRHRIARVRMHRGPDGIYALSHRLIMEEHLGRKLTLDEHVHHIDGNPLNNTLENLAVLTKRAHQQLHGKLTDTDVRAIRLLATIGHMTQKYIAQRFHVHQTTISYILRGKLHASVV